ncbi:MAG: ABC transporter substrate-binding protein [Acidobacteriota bacterium]|nr:ABC transporter substrate-binding protein [Acidobacteriota bacterium]
MIDAPGSWSTGPFTLVEGYSSLDNEIAIINSEPFAATWMPTREDRTPRLRLAANTNYWDTARGPRLAEAIFRNDISYEDALELVCTTEGEVDIVTNVRPDDAGRVEGADYAKLVAIDALRAVVGIINRDAPDFPLNDKRARQALNICVERERIVDEGLFGRAQPLAGLTPPSAVTFIHRLSPYAHDAATAVKLWREANEEMMRSRGAIDDELSRPPRSPRPLRIATTGELERIAQLVASSLRETIGFDVEVTLHSDAEKLQLLRHLAEKKSPPEWDIFLYAWSGQAADAPPLGLHRAFVGWDGELRAGQVVPEFDEMYQELKHETNAIRQSQISYQIDKFVYEEALALFLCAPQALYAVNKEVDFTAYRTTFELAECSVSSKHWSRIGDGATST